MQGDYKPPGIGDQSGSNEPDRGSLWIPVHAGLILAVVILISACIPILYLWNHSSKALDNEVQVALLETAQSAALLINGDLHATFTSPNQEQEKNYLVQVGKLRRFMLQNPRLASLRTYILRDGKVHVILDTAKPNSSKNKDGHASIMDIQINPSAGLLKALREKIPAVETSPHANQWGTFVSGYAPIYDSNDNAIGAVGADISIEELAASKLAIRKSAIIGLFLALFCSIAAGLGVYTLRRKTMIASREALSAQVARKAAEFRYQHLFEQIPIGVINYNKDLIVTDCNERILEIGSSSRNDLIGMNLNRLQNTRLLPCLMDALHNRESVYIGEYNITENVKNKWVEIHAAPIKDASGGLIAGIATIEDITLKHRAEMMSETEKNMLGMIARGDSLEHVLLKLVESIEALLPESLCAVYLLDKEKKLLLRGISRSLPSAYLDLTEGTPIGPKGGPCGIAAFTRKPVITIDIQTDPLWNNHKQIAARFNLGSCWSMPILSGKDNVYGTFAVYHPRVHKPDAFEHTLLENAGFLAGIAIERSLFEQAIFEERNLLRTLIDNIPDVIFIKNRDHQYLAANEAAFKALSMLDKSTLIGKTDKDILQEATARENHKREQRILDGFAELNEESVETDSNGNVRFISTSRMPLRNAEGEIIGLVTIGRDVTDQKRVEEERIKSQKLESLGILAGGIAHDFNNILTSVLGNLSFVTIAEKNMSPENEELLNEAATATQRAKYLTQQLLTFAKGGQPVKKLSSIANLLKESATFAARGSASKVEFDLPDDLWMTDIDSGQISQVIQNLFFNADQAMPGGGLIRISGRNLILEKDNIQDLPVGRYIAVSIADNGCGIPEQVRERIFDPYFTTKKAGSGLGLTTTFSIISKHGGHISVDSKKGKGATFTFILPAAAEPTGSGKKKKPEVITSSSAHILIMDDEEAIRKISSRILERAGFSVSVAENGEEAVRVFNEAIESGTPIDLVILDLTIPGGMGGKETIKQLKEIDANVRAIVSSGYSVDEIMSRHEAFGFVGVVTKPYDQQELITAIKTALTATSV